MKHIPWIVFAILAYCAWNSMDLLNAWKSAPIEQLGWVLFLIWSVPAWMFWTKEEYSFSPYLLGAALGCSLFGVFTSMNTACYFGLAIAIGSCIPRSWLSYGWLVSAIGWMPAAGWLFSHLFYHVEFTSIFMIRLFIVCMGFYCAWRLIK